MRPQIARLLERPLATSGLSIWIVSGENEANQGWRNVLEYSYRYNSKIASN